MVLHVAFGVSDLKSERQRLLLAGATAVGDVTVTPAGDELAMLRDPWGLAVQLVKRAKPLHPGERESGVQKNHGVCGSRADTGFPRCRVDRRKPHESPVNSVYDL
jgi:hypothetical protein